MEVLKSFKPDSEFIKNFGKYTTENLILYSLIVYTITGNTSILLFIVGLGINGLMYFLLKNDTYYPGKKFPSLSVQSIMFLYSFIITKKILDNDLKGMSPLFLVIGAGIIYLIITANDVPFISILVGGSVGLLLGIVYSWLIYKMDESKKEGNEEVNLYGAPYSDYNKCETIEEENLPRINQKERSTRDTCV